ncbi:MAG: FG-GAP repeat domain-containing protein [Planctomycetota bacterium]
MPARTAILCALTLLSAASGPVATAPRTECLAFAAQAAPPAFTKRTLSKDFLAEGCTAADFNNDGARDVCVGRFIWLGPAFDRRVAYTPERVNADGITRAPYRADTGYSDYFEQFAHDFDGDGWTDILVYGPPGTPASVFVNPRAAQPADEMDWARHDIFDSADGESPDLVDITGDGWPELLCFTGGRYGYAAIDRANPLAKARFRPVSAPPAEGEPTIHRYTHGYGAGDVNGDGRTDILTSGGWYEQPADASGETPWTLHRAAFGDGGAQMYALDANGDGRADIVTSIKAHGYGLSWFEQSADGSFTERVILGRAAADNADGAGFSQLHALRIADIDGDGLPDIVTGKRRWAHGPLGDEEPMAPPVVRWFRQVRDASAPGGARFEQIAIDADSGVGTQFWTGNLDADGKPDIVVGNKHGAFVFTQR